MRTTLLLLGIILPINGATDQWTMVLNHAKSPTDEDYKWVCVPQNQCIDNEVDTAATETMRTRLDLYCKDKNDVLCKYKGNLNLPFELPVSPYPFTAGRLPKKPVDMTTTRPTQPFTGCGIRSSNAMRYLSSVVVDYAEAGEFPWTVAIYRKPNTYVRVGSLIHHRVVLTVAHHLNTRKLRRNLFIKAGDTNRDNENPITPTVTMDVEEVILHKDYDTSTGTNDIALLHLSSSISPNENVGFACLPSKSLRVQPPTVCYVTGWGSIALGEPMQKKMKQIEMPIVSHDTCQLAISSQKRYNPEYRLPDSVLCAGGQTDEEGFSPDVCTGDGGAPLVCQFSSSNRFYQAGIVSWGTDCGTPGIPSIFTSVPAHRDWIDKEMRKLNYLTDTYTPPDNETY